MYREHTVGVVIPAYNEAGRVGEVIESIPDYVDRIYAVDDASTDDTWAEIRRHADAVDRSPRATERSRASVAANGGAGTPFDRRAIAIRHPENRGVGGAIKTGYRRALDDEIDVTAVMAGDGQMDPDRLDRLLDPIVEGRADYAKGNRLLADDYRDRMPPFRLFGNVLLTVLTKIASGYWRTSDSQNGYTAISRRALEAVDIESMFEYYGYCNDLLVRLNARDLRVADVPIPPIYGDEESYIAYSRYVPRVSLLLLRSFLWRLWVRYLITGEYRLALSYLGGAIAAGGGALQWCRSQLANRNRDDRSSRGAEAGLSTVLAGCTLLVSAMVGEYRRNEHLEVREDD